MEEKMLLQCLYIYFQNGRETFTEWLNKGDHIFWPVKSQVGSRCQLLSGPLFKHRKELKIARGPSGATLGDYAFLCAKL